MTATAEKYMIRRRLAAVPDEPERLDEHDALKVLVGATGGGACPSHSVSVVAAHMAGPVAAVPPEGHDLHGSLNGSRGLRGSMVLNRLVVDACGLRDQNGIRCRYENDHDGLCPDAHPMTVLARTVCQGRIARPHSWGSENRDRVQKALAARDVDRMVHAVCPRTFALVGLSDRARAEHGGDLSELVAEAAVVVLRTLAGPTKWDTLTGWARGECHKRWPWTAVADECDRVMRQDFVFDRLVARVIEGA
jgi:hypothetical protein